MAGTGALHVRPPESWRHDAAGAGRVHRAVAAHGRRHTRTSSNRCGRSSFHTPTNITSLLDPTFFWALRIGQLFVGALTFVVAINLAILIYARTVTRLGELAVRSALGASRGRILTQLFVEALALAAMGAVAGVVLTYNALVVIQSLAHSNGGMPFWIHFDLSVAAAIYAVGLAVLAAIVMGVLPGLKATGVGLTVNLHELTGRAGSRLGATWTTLVVAQVAVAVAVLPAAGFMTWQVVRMEATGPGFAAETIAVGTATLSGDGPAVDSNRVTARQEELMARLRAEPRRDRRHILGEYPGVRRIAARSSSNLECGCETPTCISLTSGSLASPCGRARWLSGPICSTPTV